jgi:type II secretory pathway component PulM
MHRGFKASFLLYMTFASLLNWVALFDERTGLSFARITVSKKDVVLSAHRRYVLREYF